VSVVNSIGFSNNNPNQNMLAGSGVVAYGDKNGAMYVANSIFHANGDPNNWGYGSCGAGSGNSILDFINVVCYKPLAATTAAQWAAGLGGSVGSPSWRSRNSIYIPFSSDSERMVYRDPHFTYAQDPSSVFTVWSNNAVGIAQDTSPALFQAAGNLTTFAANDYRASGPTSRLVDRGTPYCKVLSASGSGMTFSVDCDPRLYFYVNANRPGVPADTAYLGIGSNNTCSVSALSANQITCSNSVAWSSGDSVGRKPIYGSAPDIGAYEFTGSSSLLGDLDGNGTIDAIDLQRLVNVLLGLEANPKADLDGDGTATILDLQQLVNILLGV
jgi:hypothetical protein